MEIPEPAVQEAIPGLAQAILELAALAPIQDQMVAAAPLKVARMLALKVVVGASPIISIKRMKHNLNRETIVAKVVTNRTTGKTKVSEFQATLPPVEVLQTMVSPKMVRMLKTCKRTSPIILTIKTQAATAVNLFSFWAIIKTIP